MLPMTIQSLKETILVAVPDSKLLLLISIGIQNNLLIMSMEIGILVMIQRAIIGKHKRKQKNNLVLNMIDS
jgi:hypothetical protein